MTDIRNRNRIIEVIAIGADREPVKLLHLVSTKPKDETRKDNKLNTTCK